MKLLNHSASKTWAILAATLLISACSGETLNSGKDPSGYRDDYGAESFPPDDVRGGPHVLPVKAPGPVRTAPPAGAHLTYYDGPVISSVRVYSIFWNSSVANQSQLNAFFTGVTNSPYMDWLSEYNTTVMGGTNQTIGRGSLAATYVDTGAPAGASITDAQIQAELTRLIHAGAVPEDSAAHPNALYYFFFPAGISISMGGSGSCTAFCGYHGTYTLNGHNVYYAVIPDVGCGGSGSCGVGMGGLTQLTATYSVSSHELIEAITDSAVGLAGAVGPPLAWYDATNGEIGDICAWLTGPVTGGDGNSYTVQQEWSNQSNACIIQRTATNDFSIAVSPATLTIAPGASGNYTVTLAVTSGSAQAVNLSVSGLPAGVTGTFTPASVTGNGTSTLRLTVAAGTAGITQSFTVTGTGTSATHTATASVTVSGGTSNDFSVAVSPASQTIAAGSSGTYTVSTATTAGSAQTVNLSISGLPSGVTGAFSPAAVTSGTSSTLTLTVAAGAAAGTTSFTVTGTAASGAHTASAAVTVTTGSGTELVVNGGFETGNFTGWTQGGGITRVTSVAHSGTRGARVGSTGAYNGASTLYQRVHIPATGTTTLSLWYLLSSNDTYVYDQQQAFITDVSFNHLAKIFDTCASQGWTHFTMDLTPYKGRDILVYFKDTDDGYAGDPTYLRIDDVSITNR